MYHGLAGDVEAAEWPHIKDERAWLAQRLAREGYAGLFLAGDSSTAGDVFDGNAAALQAIVGDAGAGDLERVLAAEVLYRCGDGPDADRDVLAGIYTRALALTGSHTLPREPVGRAVGHAG